MKNFAKKLTLSLTTAIMLFGFAQNVFAVAPLSVIFDPNPLFNKPNFLPQDKTTGTVTVTNNSDTAQNILTEAINIIDGNNFGSLLHLKIVGDSGTLFDNTLAYFFSNAGELSLGTIASGESKIYTYTISFIDSSDNSYQGKTLGFDVCVGFAGGNTHCGNTVISDEGDTGNNNSGNNGNPPNPGTIIPGSGGGGGGGGGGGSGEIILSIFNEQAVNISNEGGLPETASATISWDTNKLSTSQVVYGLASSGPYGLVLTPPNFGYPFYTTEDPTKVLHHSVLITGLVPGQTYLYRVISHASPPTVSFEHQFTVPTLAILTQVNQVNNNSAEKESGSSPYGNTSESNVGTNNSALPSLSAGVIFSGFEKILSFCSLISLFLLLVIYLIWKIWLREKYRRNGISREKLREKFSLFFGGSSLFLILVFGIYHEYCPIPVFIISFAISVCLYFFSKFNQVKTY